MEDALASIVAEERRIFAGHPVKAFQYGTAGFRERGELLETVVFRIGLLAAIRSKCTKATIGVMITASHNPVEDNGVKVVEPHGEMLLTQWEGFATAIANARTEDLPGVVRSIVTDTGCDFDSSASVAFARDTRPSSEPLARILATGLTLIGAKHVDYGVLTTPQLHYMVRCINTGGEFGVASEEGYYTKMATAFRNLTSELKHTRSVLKLDGANGVGAEKMAKLVGHLDNSGVLRVKIYNDGTTGTLNEKCGADYVKVQQLPPVGLEFATGDRCASFDGDADRLMYFYKDNGGHFRLLDGDKISSLVAGFIAEKLKVLESDLSFGVVQTAYANGSSTTYLVETLRVPVSCALTGVKYVHSKALHYDIGVYFEANGHGTVLFSHKAIESFKRIAASEEVATPKTQAAKDLFQLSQLINQAVGDAISDLLLVEVVLSHRQWGCSDWEALYCDLANRQLKVKVKDRAVISTTDEERKCLTPVGLQTEIDILVSQFPKGRSFVRPSGTEDVVRVYAEAEGQSQADHLAYLVALKVHELAGGIGERPSPPKC
ncbi:hypothetical protein EMCRGX_G029596 [Ephydatia muelleri]